MDRHIAELLKENNLEVGYLPTHGKGFYIETPKRLPDQIILNDSLSELEAKKVIYHEIGHKLHDNDVPGNYKDDYLTHIKSEDSADDFKMKMLVAEFSKLGYETSAVNYADLALAIGTRDIDKVRKELQRMK